jgi:transketolase N-terminal domain/subunit
MQAFGRAVHQTDANDAPVIVETVESLPQGDGMPRAIIANTRKGT